MTKKTKFIFSALIGSIAVIIIALSVLIKVYITPERIRAFLIPRAEKILNRSVDIGELNISLFKGIEVKDFTIKEIDGKTDFLKSKVFVLKYKILPLLSKQLIIDELKILSPEIRIVRDRDGKFNFEDIGENKPQKIKEKKDTAGSKGLPVSLLISKLILKDAIFTFTDHKKELPDIKGSIDINTVIESAGETELFSEGNIDLRLDEIAVKKPSEKYIKNITVELEYGVYLDLGTNSIQINKADIKAQKIAASITGNVINLKTTPEIDISVSIPVTETADILRSVKPFVDTKGITLSGDITADLKIKGMLKNVDSLKTDAKAALRNVSVTYNDLSTVLNGDLKFNLTSNSIHIDKADIKAQKIFASITGDVINLKTTPEIDISVSIPVTETADILQSVKPFVDTKGIALSGDITADLKIKGMPKKLDTLKINGKINLGKVGVIYNNISAVLDGDLKFREQSMDINIKSSIGKNRAELKGSVNSYFKNQDIRLNLYSRELLLDYLIPHGKTKNAVPAGEEKTASKKIKKQEAEPLDLKLTAKGEIKIDSAVYKGMKMDDFSLEYQLKNNRFEIIKMTALAGKGRFSLNSLIDLSKPGYTYNLASNIASLYADEVINSLFPRAKDTIFGILSLDLKISGSGTLPENIKKNLVGNGSFNIKNGKITNSKLPDTLAHFLGIDKLKTIKLKEAKGTVKIKKGAAKLKSIFSSDELSMNPSGKIGLDETLNLAFDLKLSPGLTDKAMSSDISQYIKNEEGWGLIPLKVTGTFSDPSFGIDIEKAGKRIIKKKAKKLIDNLFEKDGDSKKAKDSEESPEEPLKDLLKGLFE